MHEVREEVDFSRFDKDTQFQRYKEGHKLGGTQSGNTNGAGYGSQHGQKQSYGSSSSGVNNNKILKAEQILSDQDKLMLKAFRSDK